MTENHALLYCPYFKGYVAQTMVLKDGEGVVAFELTTHVRAHQTLIFSLI